MFLSCFYLLFCLCEALSNYTEMKHTEREAVMAYNRININHEKFQMPFSK